MSKFRITTEGKDDIYLLLSEMVANGEDIKPIIYRNGNIVIEECEEREVVDYIDVLNKKECVYTIVKEM